jgi:putative tryptophan/tyrosine transport system substrate-binding protein
VISGQKSAVSRIDKIMKGIGEKRMSRKVFAFVCLLLAVFLTAVLADAQQRKKVPGIGYLRVAASSNPARSEAFRQGLLQLGYVERKNIVFEYRSAEQKLDRLPALAVELAGLKVDVIITSGPRVTRAAREATTTIPIVMAQDGDPVANGFVTSLARPAETSRDYPTLRRR